MNRKKIWIIISIMNTCFGFLMFRLRYILYPTDYLFIFFGILEFIIFIMLLYRTYKCMLN